MNSSNSLYKFRRRFDKDLRRHSRQAFFCLLFFAAFVAVAAEAAAQDDLKEVPPPIKALSKEEKSALEAQSDVKKRTILTLELMEARLLKAEDFKTKEDFRSMFEELGGFHALMDNTLDYLKRNNTGSGKVLNNFKRIEITLRKNLNRLELIRRDSPPEYEPYLRRLVKYVREARSKAVEPLFGETVLRDNDPDNDNEK